MTEIPNVVRIFDAYEKLNIDPKNYHTQQLPSVIVEKVRYWCGDLDLITRIVNDDIKTSFYDKYHPNAYWIAEIHYQKHKLNTTQIMEKLLQIGFMIYNRLVIIPDGKGCFSASFLSQ